MQISFRLVMTGLEAPSGTSRSLALGSLPYQFHELKRYAPGSHRA